MVIGPMRNAVILGIAGFLVACGSGRPAWLKQQEELLKEDTTVAGQGTKTTKAKPTGAAPEVGVGDTTPPHCIGFHPSGTGAMVIIADDDGGSRHLRAAVAGEGLTEVTLVKLATTSTEEAVFGDAQQESINAGLPKINEQLKATGLLTCVAAEPPSAGGFRRTERVLVAWTPKGETRVTLRDNAVFVTPAGKAARAVRQIEPQEGHEWRLEATYYNEGLDGFVVVLTDEWGAAARTELVWVGSDKLD